MVPKILGNRDRFHGRPFFHGGERMVQVVMWVMENYWGDRWSFSCVPATHLLLCSMWLEIPTFLDIRRYKNLAHKIFLKIPNYLKTCTSSFSQSTVCLIPDIHPEIFLGSIDWNLCWDSWGHKESYYWATERNWTVLPWSDGTGCHDLSFLNVEF